MKNLLNWLQQWISNSNEQIAGKGDSQASSGSSGFGSKGGSGGGSGLGSGDPPGGSNGRSPLGSFRWLMILGLTGAAIMIMTSFLSVEQEGIPMPQSSPTNEQEAFIGKNSNEPMTMADYEEIYEARLREILPDIVGVGAVSVLVTIESTEEIVVVEDNRSRKSVTEEKDQHGATRYITDVQNDGQVVIYNAPEGEKPIIVKKIKPQVRGVLIVAKGAENIRVQKMIIDAVAKSLSVPVHRIAVMPKKH
jgi:stage III sporulation protein AG